MIVIGSNSTHISRGAQTLNVSAARGFVSHVYRISIPFRWFLCTIAQSNMMWCRDDVVFVEFICACLGSPRAHSVRAVASSRAFASHSMAIDRDDIERILAPHHVLLTRSVLRVFAWWSQQCDCNRNIYVYTIHMLPCCSPVVWLLQAKHHAFVYYSTIYVVVWIAFSRIFTIKWLLPLWMRARERNA